MRHPLVKANRPTGPRLWRVWLAVKANDLPWLGDFLLVAKPGQNASCFWLPRREGILRHVQKRRWLRSRCGHVHSLEHDAAVLLRHVVAFLRRTSKHRVALRPEGSSWHKSTGVAAKRRVWAISWLGTRSSGSGHSFLERGLHRFMPRPGQFASAFARPGRSPSGRVCVLQTLRTAGDAYWPLPAASRR